MFSRRPLVTILALFVLGLTTTPTIGASAMTDHTMYVTFNRPVGLPGVTLAPGTYIFETPDATGDHTLVRVSSRDRSIVIYTAFTRTVDRTPGIKRDQAITFGEGAAYGVQPIAAWWPYDSAGHQFIYPKQ